MKSLKRVGAIGALMVALAAHAGETAKVTVEGMVCAFCAQGIEKGFKKQAAVERVYVSLENKIVAMSFKANQKLTDEAITKTIVDAGYVVKSIDRSEESIDAIKARVKAKS